MVKKLYLVENVGCDDTTVGILALTQEEFEFLSKVFEQLNKNSDYSCQPTIHFNLEQKFEKIEGYKDEYEYRVKNNDWDAYIKTINGNLYKLY